jgi:hypothetical protein
MPFRFNSTQPMTLKAFNSWSKLRRCRFLFFTRYSVRDCKGFLTASTGSLRANAVSPVRQPCAMPTAAPRRPRLAPSAPRGAAHACSLPRMTHDRRSNSWACYGAPGEVAAGPSLAVSQDRQRRYFRHPGACQGDRQRGPAAARTRLHRARAVRDQSHDVLAGRRGRKRATDFAEGKRWVGVQLRRIGKLRPQHRDETAEAR